MAEAIAPQDVIDLLVERGVTGADALISGVEAEYGQPGLSGALGAISRWDDQGSDKWTPPIGPLVQLIRGGGLEGYRRKHDRTSVEGVAGASTDELMNTIRRMGLSTKAVEGTGCTREQLRDMIAHTARRLETPADALIDTALHPAWQETPVYPGKLIRAGEDPELAGFRYTRTLDLPHIPYIGVPRRDYESYLDFAMRFWDYTEPPEVVAFAKELAERKAREAAEAAERERVLAELAAKRASAPNPRAGGVQDAGDNSPPSGGQVDPGPPATAPPATPGAAVGLCNAKHPDQPDVRCEKARHVAGAPHSGGGITWGDARSTAPAKPKAKKQAAKKKPAAKPEPAKPQEESPDSSAQEEHSDWE